MSKEASYPSGSSFPTWQSEVQAAVSETDAGKMLQRVHAAEIGIFNRLQELAKHSSTDGADRPEREAIAKALESLRALKRDKLGFPDWTEE